MSEKKVRKPKVDLSHIVEGLRKLAVPVSELVPDSRNARRHPQRNLESIAGSLGLYGQRKPLVVHKTTRTVLAGNGTLEAAKSLGWTHVAVVYVEDDPNQAAGYSLADNRTAETAEWDYRMLSEIMREQHEKDQELLSKIGWEPFEYEPLLAAQWEKPEPGTLPGGDGDKGGSGAKDAVYVMNFEVDADGKGVVERALGMVEGDKGAALVLICKQFLGSK